MRSQDTKKVELRDEAISTSELEIASFKLFAAPRGMDAAACFPPSVF